MPPDRPLAAGGGFAVRADDVGELFVELPLYRPTLFRRAKAGPADSCFLAIGYALGTAVEVIVHPIRVISSIVLIVYVSGASR
jgi:hypothetical protein